MSLRSVFVLMVLFIVLGTFAIFDPLHRKQKRDEAKEREDRVFWLKDKKLDSIRIRHGGLEIKLECATDGGCPFDGSADWRITEPLQDGADPSAVGSVASSTLNLSPVDKIDLEPDPKEFGFDSPTVELEFRVRGESEPYGLVFGRDTPVGPNVYARSSREARRVYMVASYFPGMLKKDVFHWRNKRFFQLEAVDVESLSWTGPKGEFRIARADGAWKLERPVAARANHIMSEGLVSTLVFAAAKSVHSGKAPAGKPVYEFRMKAKPGRELRLSLFALPSAKPYEKNYVARVAGRDTLYTTDGLAFDRFAKDALEYRERRVLTVDEKSRVDEMVLSFPREKKRIELKRVGADWQPGGGDKPETLSQTRIKNFLDGLAIAEAETFDAKGPSSVLFRRVPGDLELELKAGGVLVKRARFVIVDRSRALTEGDAAGEVKSFGGEFLKVLPVRFTDLYESSNKQVVVPAGQKEHDGHDHSSERAR